MPQKREIIYPFFLECTPLAQDHFWETIFEDLAYGRPPQGTYIAKGCLCCSYRGREFSYKLERRPPELLYQDVYTLLKEKVGILSKKEKEKRKTTFAEYMTPVVQSWGEIRKKNVKDMLYEEYALSMKAKHHLDYKQCRYLLALIVIAVGMKIITARDIDFENGSITNIRGISFVQGEFVLDRIAEHFSDEDTGGASESEILLTKKFICENWPSYIQNLLEN